MPAMRLACTQHGAQHPVRDPPTENARALHQSEARVDDRARCRPVRLSGARAYTAPLPLGTLSHLPATAPKLHTALTIRRAIS